MVSLFFKYLRLGFLILPFIGSSVVHANPTQSGTVNFSVNSSSVKYNGSVALLWYTTNMKSCTASGDWMGNVALSGGQAVSNLKSNANFILTCSNSFGNITKSVQVNVAAAQPAAGVCGSANGTPVSKAPTSNLCVIGTPSAVQGNGPWTWNCLGVDGGAIASCSAPVLGNLTQRIQAAQATAKNTSPQSTCGTISKNATGYENGFYWEIGDQNGVIRDPASGLTASGSVQPAGTTGTNYTRTTILPVASATKFLYGGYVVETKAIKNADGSWSMPSAIVPHLNFTSGYTNMSDDSCAGGQATTVLDCVNHLNGNVPSMPNGTLSKANVGFFYYNGGHMETLEAGTDPAIAGVMNGGLNNDAALAKEFKNAFSAKGVKMTLTFAAPMTPGGAVTSAGDYAAFLQGIIKTSNPLTISYFLKPSSSDPYSICTSTTDHKCVDANGNPLSKYTPVPPNLSWHYGLGHWIEDDPTTGDGSYSSAGKFGFYPWVDSTKTYYGVISRYDTNPIVQDGAASAMCGASIRKAFKTGVVQN